LIKPLLLLGFKHVDYYYVHGEGTGNRLILGDHVSTADAVFNISSGNITVGNHTTFGHNCFILTGFHQFVSGKLARFEKSKNRLPEVPSGGYDITIGEGCYIGSGAIILRGVCLGAHTRVAAGAVVTKSFEGGFVAGLPAIQK
jgi:acetyltransferase-like isoleucine patch superfamily enzyme